MGRQEEGLKRIRPTWPGGELVGELERQPSEEEGVRFNLAVCTENTRNTKRKGEGGCNLGLKD